MTDQSIGVTEVSKIGEKEVSKTGKTVFEIGEEEVSDISKKLENFQAALTESGSALLSGIFSIAADVIRPGLDGRGSTSLVSEAADAKIATVALYQPRLSLSEQFVKQFKGAFTPDPPEPIRPLSSVVIPRNPEDDPPR